MEKYSDMYDCFILAIKLSKEKIGKKMEFTSSIYQGILEGKYHFYPSDIYNTYSEYIKDALDFCIKYNQEHFLRLQIYDSLYRHTIGEKLAILSEIYPILTNLVGNATLYYTIKNDLSQTITLHWAFTNKEEEVAKYQSDKAFDDKHIDELIIMNNEQASEENKDWFENTIHLPIELLPIVIKNLNDFIAYRSDLSEEDISILYKIASKKTTLSRQK